MTRLERLEREETEKPGVRYVFDLLMSLLLLLLLPKNFESQTESKVQDLIRHQFCDFS